MKNTLMVKPLANLKNKQSGFTMIEMMIVMAVIAVLIGIGLGVYGKMVTNAKISDSKAFMERSFVIAATSCNMKFRNYTSCTKAELVKEGLETNTPWDAAWTSSVATNVFTITYPTKDADTAATLATTFSNSGAVHITSAAVVNTKDVKVVITMQ